MNLNIKIDDILTRFQLNSKGFNYKQRYNFQIIQMQSNPTFIQIIDMGFSPVLAEASIRKLQTSDLTSLVDWISQHEAEQQLWKKWLEQNKQNPQQEIKTENKSVSHLVNQQLSQVLQTKGHSKAVAEKALLFTNSVSIQSAQAWIQNHKYDIDFEEELILEGQSEQIKLTPEQAKIKLKELTQKARQIRKQREEEEAKEREKNRVRYGKQLTEAKRIAEQQAMKRKVQLDKIEKGRDEKYKKQLLQQMKRQREVKLGLKPTAQKAAEKQKQKPKLTKTQQLQIQCEQVKVGMHAYPDKARVFFQTAQIYVNNIIKNNGQEKFRKINKENKAFQSRIAEVFGGIQTLLVLGYQEEDNTLIMKTFDMGELNKASQLFERYKSYYN